MRANISKGIRLIAKRLGFEIVGYSQRDSGAIQGFAILKLVEQDILRGAIVPVAHMLGSALFFIKNERDHIQRKLLKGGFYEEEELEIIQRYFKGGTFVDIGSNIGNHTVFAGLFLGVKSIIAFEPNPLAREQLEINLLLNKISHLVTVFPFGLSDENMLGDISVPENNLGGGRVVRTEMGLGSVEVRVGDEILRDKKVDFIKVDVEGFELQVLKGLSATLSNNGPTVFVEIEDDQSKYLAEYMENLSYIEVESFSRYRGKINKVYVRSNPRSTAPAS